MNVSNTLPVKTSRELMFIGRFFVTMNDSDKGKPEWTGLAWRLENNYIPTNRKKEHTEYINNGS